jgi:DNA-binding response OmpR family regulator
MLPGRDGFSIIDEMRKRRVTTPVLILSARRSVDDRVRGLQAGGDDYLTKPFAFAELVARVQALVRRATQAAPVTTLALDESRGGPAGAARHQGRQGDRAAAPGIRAARIPAAECGPCPSRKTMILSHVWGYQFDPQTNVVDVLVSRLREKLDRPFDRSLLRTVRGVGYVLKS